MDKTIRNITGACYYAVLIVIEAVKDTVKDCISSFKEGFYA